MQERFLRSAGHSQESPEKGATGPPFSLISMAPSPGELLEAGLQLGGEVHGKGYKGNINFWTILFWK